MKKKLLFIPIILAMGCTNTKYEKVLFDKEEVLLSNEVNYIPPSCYSEIKLLDSVLILIDQCNNNFIHLYSIAEEEKITQAGTKGRGPNEMIGPLFYKPSISANKTTKQEVYLYDVNLQKDYALNLKGDSVGFITGTQMGTDINQRGWQLTRLKNNVIGIDLIETCMYFNYNKNTNDKSNIAYPDVYNDYLKHDQEIILDKDICVNEEKKKIVIGMHYFNHLYFYDMQGNILKSYAINKGQDPKIEENQVVSMSNYFYTFDIYGTTKNIYILWYGEKLINIEENDTQGINLLVFDWDMNFIKNYQLDKEIYDFAVDEKNRKLYGLTWNDQDEGLLVSYLLN